MRARTPRIAAATLVAVAALSAPRRAPATTPPVLSGDSAKAGETTEVAAPARSWSADCRPLARPAPLSLDAARDAFRSAERRHENRLREAAEPGFLLRRVVRTFDGWDRPQAATPSQPPFCPSTLAELGEQLFEHEFGYSEGFASGEAAKLAKSPFRRVHEGLFGGPETISCPSCHWVGGPNGAGAETDNVFLAGDGVVPSAGDARNSPALVALGVVEALAREMTADLQKQRDELLGGGAGGGDGAREVKLTSKGVDFGVLRLAADGSIDASGVDGVDADLVVKPFGWKGTRPDIASFAAEALQVHLGIQSDAMLANEPVEMRGGGKDPLDPDGDGVKEEFGRGALAAVTMHLALLELPIVEPLVQDRMLAPAAKGLLAPTNTSFIDDFTRGREKFQSLGCASCHRPMMVLRSPVLDIAGLPPIDLSREMRRPALRFDEAAGGYPVWLFSDLKRHDMGKANAAQHVQRGVAPQEYLTPRLWGVADSQPYLHDGRAPSFDYAIAGHDGEGAESRAAYAALDDRDKGALRVYLMSMRRTSRVIVP